VPHANCTLSVANAAISTNLKIAKGRRKFMNTAQRSKAYALSAWAVLLALLGGCGTQPASSSGNDGTSAARPKAAATTGVPATPAVPPPTAATVKLMTPTGELAGQAILTEMPMGVEIALTITSLAPGAHGFRIHTNGTCAAGPDPATGKPVPFGAAGEQFVPPPSNHPTPVAATSSIPVSAGETPTVTADASGKATGRYLNPRVTLVKGEASSVLGRSLVVYGNPSGRALCGVIEPAQVESVVG
jgi:Cu-Zn family superoxide dismutase